MNETATARALALHARAHAALSAPLPTKMQEIPALVGALADFLVELAQKVDAHTPYIDETAPEVQAVHEGGGDNTPKPQEISAPAAHPANATGTGIMPGQGGAA